MDKFVRNLLTEWRKLQLPFTGETFVIAVSGGADSVSLAVALNDLKTRKKLNLRFVIAHFNHRLRGEDSDRDEQFVRDLAENFNIELALGSKDFSIETGNLEQNARVARYKFLAETAENLDACAVLTAHTLNDQAETFLFNLIRGSGLDGLGAMKPIRSLDFGNQILEPNEESKIQLIRPLLNWAKREDTENFCSLNKIQFRYDTMNKDLKFNRVRIRKILLPMLKEFNPKIVETLAKTARLLREVESGTADGSRRAAKDFFSRKQDETAEKKEIRDDFQIESLSFKDLKDVFPSMRRIILRDWLQRNRGNLRRLQLSHIEAIEQLIVSRKSGRVIELPGGETIIKKQGKLVFQKMKVEK